MKGVPKESKDLIEDRLKMLKQNFPEAFVEGKLDINKLKELLGDAVETKGERYSFTWAGRTQSIRTRDKRSKATLVPSKKESVNFDTTKNVFIEGDNLEVLKILQKSYEGKIKMVYIDPPYNTGNDFVYKDDFTDSLKSYLKQTGQLGGNGEKLSTNTETSGRYHSNWLSMMYPRLFLARNLLRDDGVIFVSIDDNEVHNLRMMMNEIFGEENFVVQLVWQKGAGTQNDNKYVAVSHEYVICYAKSIDNLTIYNLPPSPEMLKNYSLEDEFVKIRGKYQLRNLDDFSIGDRPGLHYNIICPDGTILNGKEHRWRCDEKRFKWRLTEKRIVFDKDPRTGKWGVLYKQYLNEKKEEIIEDEEGNLLSYGKTPDSLLIKVAFTGDGKKDLAELFTDTYPFQYPKPVDFIRHIMRMSTKNSDVILDFFAGSGTTAHAVLEQNSEDGGNRKFILVQLPEKTDEKSEAFKAGYKTIADIGKERIRRVIKKSIDEQKQKKLGESQTLDLGFKVFKLSKSNCFVWDSEETKDPNTLVKHLEESAKGASTADKEALAFELMLREGYRLDAELQSVKQGKNSFLKASDGESTLWMCFDEEIDNHSVESLPLAKDDKLVVLDSSLTDTQKVNLSRKFRVETV